MLATYMRCMRNNNLETGAHNCWRLGLRAPLVARNDPGPAHVINHDHVANCWPASQALLSLSELAGT